KGQKKAEILNEKLNLYFKEFVVCKECKKPDTEIRKVEHFEQIKCKACGAKYTIRKL
ncbi:TPA: translation initiation factor IF-2 subunit beta, partial [archaeon]|nr:translation initiation factor IF-2 subunit beta [Candidatus Naiadarchaeales archaeon SRR2090153.bin1042]